MRICKEYLRQKKYKNILLELKILDKWQIQNLKSILENHVLLITEGIIQKCRMVALYMGNI
jgi:hypothetical protein